jgi:hypothetical protein
MCYAQKSNHGDLHGFAEYADPFLFICQRLKMVVLLIGMEEAVVEDEIRADSPSHVQARRKVLSHVYRHVVGPFYTQGELYCPTESEQAVTATHRWKNPSADSLPRAGENPSTKIRPKNPSARPRTRAHVCAQKDTSFYPNIQ